MRIFLIGFMGSGKTHWGKLWANFHEMPFYDLDEVIAGKNTGGERPKEKIELIHEALVTGIREYFHKLNFQKAILGLSGGIDSVVVAVLASAAPAKRM